VSAKVLNRVNDKRSILNQSSTAPPSSRIRFEGHETCAQKTKLQEYALTLESATSWELEATSKTEFKSPKRSVSKECLLAHLNAAAIVQHSQFVAARFFLTEG
jgi:hypothetical protein